MDEGSEVTIDVEGVIFTDAMRLEPVRRTRSSPTSNQTQRVVVRLVDHDSVVPQIEAALKRLSL